MVKYRYAKDESDGIVSAETLRGKNFIGEYTCIGCNKELIAKVNGKIMKPHFAHKADMGCNSETYLHILGKNIFYNTYLECVENNKSFTIELEHEQICSHYKDILANECDIGTKIQKHNLTGIYKEVKIESKDNEFIPDLTLLSKSYPTEKIYIEIAVTHLISEKKEHSGSRIIEIKLKDDTDLLKITKCNITINDAVFTGFKPKQIYLTKNECKCENIKHHYFYVYNSGKSIMGRETLLNIKTFCTRYNYCLIYKYVINPNSLHFNMGFEVAGNTFIDHVYNAHKKGIKIKNCFLCVYRICNLEAHGEGIRCFRFGKNVKVKSNEAAICDYYSTD